MEIMNKTVSGRYGKRRYRTSILLFMKGDLSKQYFLNAISEHRYNIFLEIQNWPTELYWYIR